MQFPRKLLACILQQMKVVKPRRKMAQDLRHKDPIQESDEGNSQGNDEDKFQDLYTDSQVGAGGQRTSAKNRTHRFPDEFEYISRSLDMFVGRNSNIMSKTN